MKRFSFIITALFIFTMSMANDIDIIYEGAKNISDWETLEISSIKFHNLKVGDTIYVYTSKVDSTSLGAFQDHEWKTIPGVINGQAITGDYEFVVRDENALNELKQFGLKIRGYHYIINKVVIKHQDQIIKTILIISSSIIFLLILITIGILAYKNKQLRKVNLQLYARNMDVLAAVDEEKRLKARYEGEIAAFKEMIQNGVSGSSVRQKYQNSTLADDDKLLLKDRIMKLFEGTDEIFAEDFNMNKLATLVNSNYKNVSQVINEQMGKNFNALLNEYRIQEACRRFNDIANYGNYTIEAIGNSVGYNSRSTFITQFKSVTGLTPSEFQKMAKEIR